MSSEVKEVLPDTDRMDTKNGLPYFHESRFGVVSGSNVFFSIGQLHFVRCRQGSAIHFAIRSQWQSLQEYKSGRKHVAGQLLFQQLTQRIWSYRLCLAADHIRHQPFVARTIFSSYHNVLLHTWVCTQDRLYFPELNPKP